MERWRRSNTPGNHPGCWHACNPLHNLIANKQPVIEIYGGFYIVTCRPTNPCRHRTLPTRIFRGSPHSGLPGNHRRGAARPSRHREALENGDEPVPEFARAVRLRRITGVPMRPGGCTGPRSGPAPADKTSCSPRGGPLRALYPAIRPTDSALRWLGAPQTIGSSKRQTGSSDNDTGIVTTRNARTPQHASLRGGGRKRNPHDCRLVRNLGSTGAASSLIVANSHPHGANAYDTLLSSPRPRLGPSRTCQALASSELVACRPQEGPASSAASHSAELASKWGRRACATCVAAHADVLRHRAYGSDSQCPPIAGR